MENTGKRVQAALGDQPAENYGTRYQGCLIKDHVVSSVCTVKWKRTISSPWDTGGRGAEGKWRIYLVDSIASTRLYKQRIIVMADSELTTRRFPGIISPSG